MRAKAATPKPKREPARQTVHALQVADAQLKIQTVIEVTGRSESTIRRLVADGAFPAPVKHGTRCTRWVAGQVAAWLRAQAGAAQA